jgi:diguanylate cyclase (GGDEF)-like protein
MESFIPSYSRALVVDSHEPSRSSIKETLKGIFAEFVEADAGLNAIRAFVETKPNFIITDTDIEDISSFNFISTIRGLSDGRDVPIMLLSERGSLKNELSCPGIGASDFIIKPFEEKELAARVATLLRTRRLMDELRQKNALLEKLAVTDELTGLYNRRYFFKTVREQLSLAERHSWDVSFLAIDIDHFKYINDTYGHSAGDEVLKKAGRLLNSCKREGELLARFGGEEFVICLLNTDLQSTLLAAERFRRLFRQHDFSTESCPDISLTVSIGVAMYPHGTSYTIDDALNSADYAMYKSKMGGRDRVSLFDWTTMSVDGQLSLLQPA